MFGQRGFDDLARSLAARDTAVSRRGVLKGVAAGTFGSLLVGGSAQAAGAGKSGCAAFCSQVFGPDTAATTQCIKQAKLGAGLCYTCGPGNAGGTQSICCTRNSGGFCSSYSSATCCVSGTVCQSGVCAAICAGSGDACTTDPDCCGELTCQGAGCAGACSCGSVSTGTGICG